MQTHYRPRDMRSKYLGNLAFAVARQNGASALEATLNQIDATFGNAAAVNSFKQRVERYILFGPEHAAVVARFGARANMLRFRNLDAACRLVHSWYVTERQAIQMRSALSGGASITVSVLRELDLILRWMRAKKLGVHFPSYVYEVGSN